MSIVCCLLETNCQTNADGPAPLFRLSTLGNSIVVLTSVALLEEVCDESRFQKQVFAGVKNLRAAVHDGLFTAYEGEHNWDLAHRILLPVFGPTKIREMLSPMKDIAQQLCLKW
jgi:cytochrome P450 / NADPH-cytochrome P450 reductase